MGFKPIPHRHAVRAFLPGPLGVARAIPEIKMNSILRFLVHFSHEWHSWARKCTHECHSWVHKCNHE